MMVALTRLELNQLGYFVDELKRRLNALSSFQVSVCGELSRFFGSLENEIPDRCLLDLRILEKKLNEYVSFRNAGIDELVASLPALAERDNRLQNHLTHAVRSMGLMVCLEGISHNAHEGYETWAQATAGFNKFVVAEAELIKIALSMLSSVCESDSEQCLILHPTKKNASKQTISHPS